MCLDPSERPSRHCVLSKVQGKGKKKKKRVSKHVQSPIPARKKDSKKSPAGGDVDTGGMSTSQKKKKSPRRRMGVVVSLGLRLISEESPKNWKGFSGGVSNLSTMAESEGPGEAGTVAKKGTAKEKRGEGHCGRKKGKKSRVLGTVS